MEWKSEYNSFNSDKGLTYYENYKQMVRWLDHAPEFDRPLQRTPLYAPIEVNLDPIAFCNLDCKFCITQRYLKHHREELGMTKLPIDYMIKLVDFLTNWQVRGLCISGGGEPTLHPDLPYLIDYASKRMKVSLVTNATKLFPEALKCRWVAMSVDAATRETYKKIKGKDKLPQVYNNIADLALQRKEGDADLCFKFLLMPDNQYEIYDACKLAKELGIQDFHLRPADLERSDLNGLLLHQCKDDYLSELDGEAIHEQFRQCHELATENFHIYTITHKFNPQFRVEHNFTRCLATPLQLPILTDGNAYLCPDKKMEQAYKLGSCYPDPHAILTWWGSDSHRELIKSVRVDSCSKCTWCKYNEQIENVILQDKMCVDFP